MEIGIMTLDSAMKIERAQAAHAQLVDELVRRLQGAGCVVERDGNGVSYSGGDNIAALTACQWYQNEMDKAIHGPVPDALPTPPSPAQVEAEEKMKSRGHHPTSPSSLNARFLSPCFTPNSGTNKAAERGTLQHAAADDLADNLELDDDEAYAVSRVLNFLESTRAKIHAEGHNVLEIGEQYLPIDDAVVKDEHGNDWVGTTGGYADKILFWYPDDEHFDCVVTDWKFGRYAVTPAQYNAQGWAYVLGMVHRFRGTRKLRNATVAFFSPHRREEPSIHTFTGAEMEDRRLAIMAIVDAVHRFKAAAGPSDKWLEMPPEKYRGLFRMSHSTCQFCANLGKCPMVADLAVRVAKVYKPVEIPADINGWNDPSPTSWAQALQVGSIVRNWAEAYRKRRTEAAMETDQLPEGYELQATYPRKVVKPKEFVQWLRSKIGDVADTFVDVSITPVEEYIKKQAPRGQKAAAVEQFAQEIESAGFVQRSDKPTLMLRMK